MSNQFMFFKKLLNQNLLKNVNLRNLNLASQEKGGEKIRFYKKVFATGLFAATFSAAIYLRKKKQFKSLFDQAKLIKPKFGRIQLYEYNGFLLPQEILQVLPNLLEFIFRPDDIVLVSFPKTGATLLQEIVYLLMNDLDFNKAKSADITQRFPFLEWPIPGLNYFNQLKGPRLIKTHIPPSILFKDKDKQAIPKLITIVRNPKDTLISYYFFARMNKIIDYKEDLNNFAEIFVNDKVGYGPLYKQYLDAIIFKEKLQENQVLIIYYEDLIKNFEKEVEKICQFLEKPMLNLPQMASLKKHCSFDEMKNNPSVNYSHWDDLGLRNKSESKFFRSGKIGDWKNYLNQAQITALDRYEKVHLIDFFNFTYDE